MRITMPGRPGLAGITTLMAVSLIAAPVLFHDSSPAPLKRLLNSLAPSVTAAAPHFLNGKIAFDTDQTGNREIFVMNPDGTNLVNLSNHPSADISPAWSFDGTKIVFTSARNNVLSEVFVMNADGTAPTRLTNNAVVDGSPTFSPDGTKIVFHSQRPASFEIFLMNSDGSNETQLTNAPGNDLGAVFSPDGSKIAFVSERDGNPEIYIMNADGSNQTRLTNNAQLDQEPAFSPNGKKIAFQRHITGVPQIIVMNPDGSNQTQLTSGNSLKFSPVFSGDGNSISFTGKTSNNDEIFIMKADGTGQNQITNSAASDRNSAWQYLPSPDTIGVYRPSTSQFLLRNSTTAGSPDQTIAFGQAGDLPVAGDWNGDGQDTQGVFRNGQFLLRQPVIAHVAGQPIVINIALLVDFGQAGDLPVVGDWNGDGTDTVGFFRPSTGQWFLTNSPNTNNSTPLADLIFNFGSAGDTPVAGDWDGDGRDSIGTFNAGSWALRNTNSAGPADITVLFGTAAGNRPVVGDWNGDGVDTIGVLLPSSVFGNTAFGLNNVNANLTGSFDILTAFGADGDLPVAGDWDVKPANAAPNIGVNNPGNGASGAEQVQTFVTTCSDPDGWHDIATIDFKIARSNGNGQGVPIAIWAQFDENHNLIRLYDPDLQTWQEGPPGSNLVLENGFVQLNLAGTTVQGSGPTGPSVQVKWEVVFKSTATGKNYKQYLQITDDAGATTAFDNVGSWSVTR